MFQETYFIDKATGTFADNLISFGLAFVLDAIANRRAKVQIEDRGDHFAVTCTPALQESWVDACAFFPGAPMLITFDKKSKQRVIKGTKLAVEDVEGMGTIAVDYEQGKRDNEAYWGWRNNLSTEDRKRWRELTPPVEPPQEWDALQFVNKSALQAYNKVNREWHRSNETALFTSLLKAFLLMTSQLPNREDEAIEYWKAACKQVGHQDFGKVTATQLVNPSAAMGLNNTKAIHGRWDNVDSHWLVEWLKYAGFRQASINRFVWKDKKDDKPDRKSYVAWPRRLSWSAHIRIHSKFRNSQLGRIGLIKADCLASLSYTRVLLHHVEEARDEDLTTILFGTEGGASDLVSGLSTTFFKNMGKTDQVMNIACIGLPRWVRPRTPQDLQQLSDALDEHIRIVRALDETRGEQFDLLRKYRDFLSVSDFGAFFQFTDAYSDFIIQRDKLAPQFTVKHLEVLMSNTEPKLSKITQSQGFRNLAYAIRMATVEAQRRSLKKNQGKYAVQYETRYGLGPELVRKAAYRNDFIVALSDFMQSYNAENARMRERMERQRGDPAPKGARGDVSMQDIDELLALMDEFGDPHLIASLLVAYGYASTWQRKEELGDAAERIDLDEAIEDVADGADDAESDDE